MYTDVALHAKVRRAVMVDAMSERAATRKFGISRKAVAKMVTHAVPPGYQRKDRPLAPKLGALCQPHSSNPAGRPGRRQKAATHGPAYF